MDSMLGMDVYYTLIGSLTLHGGVPGVDNVFREGEPCFQRYGNMLAAYERLCRRLGVVDEDKDVEIIIQSLLENERDLCLKMFYYGGLFSNGKDREL